MAVAKAVNSEGPSVHAAVTFLKSHMYFNTTTNQ